MDHVIAYAHIEHIKELVGEGRFEGILEELRVLDVLLGSHDIKEKFRILNSRYSAIQRDELLGKEIESWEKNEIFRNTLDLTDDIENIVKKQIPVIPNQSLADISNEGVLKILKLFQKENNDINLKSDKIEDLYDTKVKLYDLLFKEFDKNVELNYSRELPQILFDRIITFEKLQRVDVDTIQNFRNNIDYAAYERSIIVSALTISSINRFDPVKVHLLIDYLTDFEENVWQKALVGLILSLYRYNNRLSLFTDIERRLGELKTVDAIQSGIVFIERILRLRLFSITDQMADSSETFIEELRIIFNTDELTIDPEDFKEVELITAKEIKTAEEQAFLNLFNLTNFNELLKRAAQEGSITITMNEFVEYFNSKKLLNLLEYNPFGLDLNTDFYKVKQNWFKPFLLTEKLKSEFAENFEFENIPISEFIQLIEISTLLEIDKYSILLNISLFSEGNIQLITKIFKRQIYFQKLNNVSLEHLQYLKNIKEIYRYQKFVNTSYEVDLFENKLELYNKSLLDKIADKTINEKIKAIVLFDQDNYEESLKILLQIPMQSRDFDSLELIFRIYIILEDYINAEIYINDLLIYEGSLSLDRKINLFRKISFVYFKLEAFANYEKFEILFTKTNETIVDKYIAENYSVKDIRDKISIISLSYLELSVHYANNYKDFPSSFGLFFAYFNAIFRYDLLPSNDVTELLQSTKVNFIVISNLFFGCLPDDKAMLKTADFVKSFANIEFKYYVFNYLNNIVSAFNLLGAEFFKDEKSVIKNNLTSLFEKITPVAIDVFANNDKIKNIVIPFSDGKFQVQFKFELGVFIENDLQKFVNIMVRDFTNVLIEKIFQHWTEYYFDNLINYKNSSVSINTEKQLSVIGEFLSRVDIDNSES